MVQKSLSIIRTCLIYHNIGSHLVELFKMWAVEYGLPA